MKLPAEKIQRPFRVISGNDDQQTEQELEQELVTSEDLQADKSLFLLDSRTNKEAEAVERLRGAVYKTRNANMMESEVQLLGAIPRASGAAIILLSEAEMICVASIGSAPPVGTPLNLDRGLSADCVRTRAEIYCEDTAADPSTAALREHLRSAFIFPVSVSNRVVGLVEVFSASPHNFPDDQQTVIREVAARVAKAVSAEYRSPNKTETIPEPHRDRDVVPEPKPQASAQPEPPKDAVSERKAQAATQIDDIRDLFVTVPETTKSQGISGAKAFPRGLVLGIAAVLVALVVGMLLLKSRRHAPAATTASDAAASVNSAEATPVSLNTSAAASSLTATTKPSASTQNSANPNDNAKNKKPDAAIQPGDIAPAVSQQPVVVAKNNNNSIEIATAEPVPPPSYVGPGATGMALPKDLVSARPTRVVEGAPAAPAVITSGGKLIGKVMPVYPQIARTMGISGAVRLMATVGKQGNVEKVKFLNGPSLLAGAAEQAVRQWTYQPYLVNGVPTVTDVQVEVIFH